MMKEEVKSVNNRNSMESISIDIPSGVDVNIENNIITSKGALGTNVRKFNHMLVNVSKEGNKVNLTINKGKNFEKKSRFAIKSVAKEISNDINGVQNHFERQMIIVSLHFPITLETKGANLLIKNIFGERKARSIDIVGTTKVEVKDKNVKVYGIKLDDVMQTVANIRKGCVMKKKDERIFQDGLYQVRD